jgi:hypothetical protein
MTTNGDSVRIEIGSDPDTHYAYIGGDVTKFGRTQVHGDVYVDGDFEATSSGQPSTIEGNLVVDGDVTLGSHITVEGSVNATGDINAGSATVDGGTSPFDSIADDLDYGSNMDEVRIEPEAPTRPAADDLIDTRSDWYEDAGNNSNGDWPCSSGSFCSISSTVTIDAGNYDTGTLRVRSGGVLRLDPDSGPINITVDTLRTIGHGRIEIVSNNDPERRVNVFVTNKVDLKGHSRIETTGPASGNPHRAPMNWVYLRSDGNMYLNNHAEFTGVIYGAGGDSSGAYMSINDQPEVHGAIVGEVNDISDKAGLHYDEALSGMSGDPRGPSSGGDDPVMRPVYDEDTTDSDYNEIVYFQTSQREVQVN